MLTKGRKQIIIKVQNWIFFQNGNNNLETRWMGSFPQNMTLIRLIVHEKTHITDNGWTDDAPAL